MSCTKLGRPLGWMSNRLSRVGAVPSAYRCCPSELIDSPKVLDPATGDPGSSDNAPEEESS